MCVLCTCSTLNQSYSSRKDQSWVKPAWAGLKIAEEGRVKLFLDQSLAMATRTVLARLTHCSCEFGTYIYNDLAYPYQSCQIF
jgi:hypothetical protein